MDEIPNFDFGLDDIFGGTMEATPHITEEDKQEKVPSQEQEKSAKKPRRFAAFDPAEMNRLVEDAKTKKVNKMGSDGV